MSEANGRLQLDAKDSSEKYDIEVLDGNGSEYIEMDLMLGIADLHTPEAVAAAESVIAGNQPVISLAGASSESESGDLAVMKMTIVATRSILKLLCRQMHEVKDESFPKKVPQTRR
ncbi:hypothetical protein Leryth_000595 [Lithospermum erythrorhizon]|nr:hypothetical protein Leryth_000595 [Lithospermum erythrorhizon]